MNTASSARNLSFSSRLTSSIKARGSAACIGLDPRRDQLPPILGATAEVDPKGVATIYTRFCCDVIDVVAPLVPIVKPQLACFEMLGPHGMTALAEVILHAHSKGLLVLADGKRGDIGSTAEAYADGWLAGHRTQRRYLRPRENVKSRQQGFSGTPRRRTHALSTRRHWGRTVRSENRGG